MYKLVFFVPIQSANIVKEAIFKTGAGSLGNYSHCSFETQGVGQFKALDGADPTIGKVGEIEKVDELKVEILCSKNNIYQAVDMLKISHPYEEVAFEVYKIEEQFI